MADSRVSVLIDIRSKLKGLEQAQQGFGQLIKAVAGFAAAYLSTRSVINGARDIISLGAQLNHLSAQTDIAESSLITLRQAFEDNGVSADSVGRTFNDMQKKLSEAAQGTGEGRVALEQLGVSIADIIHLTPEKQFEVLTERIAALENPADRASVAMRLFGESGAALMPLFRSGGAIDEARRSLGQMPELLQRNSEQFERIDTLLGRLPGKSRQLFAGIGDMLADELIGPLEALNKIDLSGLGQRIGAFVDVAIEAFRDGTLAEFISLTIEAGFEQGTKAAKRMIDESLDWLSSGGSGWKVVLSGVMTFGTEAAKALIHALSAPVVWISAGFRKIGEEVRVIFQNAGNFIRSVFEVVINGISRGLEGLLNKMISGFEGLLAAVIEKVNAITAALPFTDGTQIEPVTIGRIDFKEVNFQESVVRPAREFNDLLEEQRTGIEELSLIVTNKLNRNLAESRDILGLQSEATDQTISATEKLNQLIKERIQLRESEAEQIAPDDSQTAGSPSSVPGAVNFASRSDSAFADFSAGQGDFGVSIIDAARAALQDYVIQAGTAAQQIYGHIGGIAGKLTTSISSSIEGLIKTTMTWGDALRSIGMTVAGSLIKAFADMATQWIMTHVIMKGVSLAWSAFSSALRAKDTEAVSKLAKCA